MFFTSQSMQHENCLILFNFVVVFGLSTLSCPGPKLAEGWCQQSSHGAKCTQSRYGSCWADVALCRERWQQLGLLWEGFLEFAGCGVFFTVFLFPYLRLYFQRFNWWLTDMQGSHTWEIFRNCGFWLQILSSQTKALDSSMICITLTPRPVGIQRYEAWRVPSQTCWASQVLTWTKVDTNNAPERRAYHSMIMDPQERIWVFGGFSHSLKSSAFAAALQAVCKLCVAACRSWTWL